jgi:predicted naringenin-chalcone synthase
MMTACLNRIGTAVPDHDIHAPFVAFARTLLADDGTRKLFDRMAERSGIAHRYAALRPGVLARGEVDADGFYRRGAFPGTAARMALYETQALDLALRAVEALDIAMELPTISHLVVASCTGFTAPGVDLQLAERLGLRTDVERILVGFMGCSAAIPALRAAHHAIRSDPAARVLVINVELCSLHLQETPDLESVLSFMLFGDGASAALVTSDSVGLALDDFRAAIIPGSQDLITWQIGDQGFRMHLSGKVPGRIAQALRQELARPDDAGILHGEGTQSIELWAVHAGGRTVLDAVETGLGLHRAALGPSRTVLHDFGNMSSATVMFVLQGMLAEPPGRRGLAMAFGPGMVAETFRFHSVGA